MDSSTSAIVHFGINCIQSGGVAKIIFPVDNLCLSFDAHIVESNVSMLLSIYDMDRLGIYLKNLENRLMHSVSQSSAKVIRLRGHPNVRWHPQVQCLFMHGELRRLHRRFGHPHAEKIVNLLERAKVSDVNANTRRM